MKRITMALISISAMAAAALSAAPASASTATSVRPLIDCNYGNPVTVVHLYKDTNGGGEDCPIRSAYTCAVVNPQNFEISREMDNSASSLYLPPYGDCDSITLYDGHNQTGATWTCNGCLGRGIVNIPRSFNDRASSMRLF